jgi:Asp-tRNA(Asn)/Glu-tRNA(Gln) amidotransferase A subunit family amidase
VQAAVAGLAAQAIDVEPWSPLVLDPATVLWHVFFCEVGAQLLASTLGASARELPILSAYADDVPERPALSAARLADAWIERDLARAAVLEAMARHRVLVCPVTSTPAFRHDERRWDVDGRSVGYLEAMRFTQWFNVLGLPAVVVPAGRSAEGLPIGVQVVGRPFAQGRALHAAARAHSA